MGPWETKSEGQELQFVQHQALCQALAMCYLLNPPTTQGMGMMSPHFQKRTEYISHAELPAQDGTAARTRPEVS